jgi:hypothetical protein
MQKPSPCCLANVALWLDENDLIINLKEGKTEALLFGTAKRICKSKRVFVYTV